MRKQLDDALKNDSRLAKIAEKIRAGSADFRDTAEYSEIVAGHLSHVLQENVGEIRSPLGKQYACEALLKDHYAAINDVLGEVQASVDEKNGIHIAPQKAAFPAERVQKVAHALEDPTVPPETIVRRAGAPVENVAKSMHDDYMEENAKFRSDAGLKCWIVRTTDGKCCSWCTSIAGRYEYGKEPQDVYRRHDNCGCTVTYENGRQRHDVWSKRTWESDQPTPVRVEPTRLTGAQGREIEQRNLSQITRFSHAQGEAVQAQNLRYRGLTSGERQIAAIKSSDELTFPRINNAPQIDKRFAEELRREYESFTNIFGDLPSLRNVNVGVYNNDGVLGHYNPNSREITLFGVGGKTGKNGISMVASQNKKKGEWSTGSPFHSFRHELGHELQEELRLNDPLWNEKIAEIEEVKKSLLNSLTNLDDSDKIEFKKNKLSLYGFLDTSEFISECVAEYANSPKKARSTSKKVVEILLRKAD
ncbi:MAG: hypothetical protein IJN57_06895 [Oscillospiraceae bacterium]|nr:hypothetical protein [Oscillospiraceae bacterium]